MKKFASKRLLVADGTPVPRGGRTSVLYGLRYASDFELDKVLPSELKRQAIQAIYGLKQTARR